MVPRSRGKNRTCMFIAFRRQLLDHCYIVPGIAKGKYDCWQSLLREYGWHTDVADMTFGSTAEDSEYTQPVTHEGKRISRCSRKDGYKVLGTILTFINRFDKELERRIRAAWCAFHKNKVVLCSKSSPLSKRLSYFTRTVHPAFFWCAGSLNLTTDQFARIRGVQRSMIRKMCHFKMRDTEVLETFMSRTNRFVNDLMEREGLLTWDIMVRREVFKWAGWVARLRTFDCSRITLHVLLHKNWEWLQTIAMQNNGRQLHGRRLKIWHTFFRENHPSIPWFELAQDSYEWSQIVQSIY
jgi:hypothetical protein